MVFQEAYNQQKPSATDSKRKRKDTEPELSSMFRLQTLLATYPLYVFRKFQQAREARDAWTQIGTLFKGLFAPPEGKYFYTAPFKKDKDANNVPCTAYISFQDAFGEILTETEDGLEAIWKDDSRYITELEEVEKPVSHKKTSGGNMKPGTDVFPLIQPNISVTGVQIAYSYFLVGLRKTLDGDLEPDTSVVHTRASPTTPSKRNMEILEKDYQSLRRGVDDLEKRLEKDITAYLTIIQDIRSIEVKLIEWTQSTSQTKKDAYLMIAAILGQLTTIKRKISDLTVDFKIYECWFDYAAHIAEQFGKYTFTPALFTQVNPRKAIKDFVDSKFKDNGKSNATTEVQNALSGIASFLDGETDIFENTNAILETDPVVNRNDVSSVTSASTAETGSTGLTPTNKKPRKN
jgi:hypothetical protein